MMNESYKSKQIVDVSIEQNDNKYSLLINFLCATPPEVLKSIFSWFKKLFACFGTNEQSNTSSIIASSLV